MDGISREECGACREVQEARRDEVAVRLEAIRGHIERLERQVAGTAAFADLVRLRNEFDELERKMEGITTWMATARGGYLVAMAVIGIVGPVIGAAVAKFMFGL